MNAANKLIQIIEVAAGRWKQPIEVVTLPDSNAISIVKLVGQDLGIVPWEASNRGVKVLRMGDVSTKSFNKKAISSLHLRLQEYDSDSKLYWLTPTEIFADNLIQIKDGSYIRIKIDITNWPVKGNSTRDGERWWWLEAELPII